MKILRFDSVGGASGDMILASLIGLGIDVQALREQLASLPIEQFEIREKPFSDHNLKGTQVTVDVPNSDRLTERNLNDIRGIINKSGLSDQVKAMSVRVFERLAKVEARVHNTSPEKIHFHEVGAMDSIVDIVASCAALEMFEVDGVAVGPLPLGHGTIQCEHGIIPVPVPATLELLKGHPVVETDEPFELVTPTGAAILMEWKKKGPSDHRTIGLSDGKSVVVATANGFGHRKLNDRANMLRATIMKTVDKDSVSADECLVLECNLDDTIPELLGSLSQKLIEKGALDVFMTPVQMKKQRPGTLLTVLCRPQDRELFLDIIFSESTTFGIREHMTQRTFLERRHVEVETPYGKIRVKTGSWKGKDITRAPEHDDCVRCAKARNVPVRTVYEAALILIK